MVSIRGVVRRAPGCPNEPVAAPCAPSPAPGAVVEVVSDSRTVATATTGEDGRFSVMVAPGTYRVVAQFAGGVPSSRDEVTVLVGAEPVHITLTLDSGIR